MKSYKIVFVRFRTKFERRLTDPEEWDDLKVRRHDEGYA